MTKTMDYNPYDELYGLIEQSKKQKEDPLRAERLKRVARVNALGEGLKALSEVVTGSMGANIYRRELPKISLMALDKYYRDDYLDQNRQDFYNQLRYRLKMQEISDRQTMERASMDDRLARDKMEETRALEAAKMQNANTKWAVEQEGQNKRHAERLAWDKSKFAQQQAAEKNEKNNKPFFGLWYADQTIPINETQFYAIADIIRKNTTSQEALQEFDMLMNGFKMGDQTATQQLKLLITQRWSEFPEAMKIGLMGTPFMKDLVRDYSGGQFNPGMNTPVAGAGNPWTDPKQMQWGAQSQTSQTGDELLKYGRKIVTDILKDGDPEKGKRIYEAMIAAGFSKEQAKSQIEALLASKKYNLK